MGRRNCSSAAFPAPVVARRAAVLALSAAMAACSPVFNWREVPLDDTLTVLLPCKPDRAQRELAWGDAPVRIDMAGCEAGGATFAVAWVDAEGPAQTQDRLSAWRAATRRQWSAAQVSEAGVTLPRAAEVPAPLELVARGSPAGPASDVQVRWFAHAEPGGKGRLYQAMVLGHLSEADAMNTFFEGLKLR